MTEPSSQRPEGQQRQQNEQDWRTQELLIRLDERTASIQKELIAIRVDMKDFVTRREISPLRMAVYGGISLMSTAFFGAITIFLTHK